MNSIAHQSDGMTEIAAQEFRGHQHQRCHQCRGEESVGGIFAWMAIACVVHVHGNHLTAEAKYGRADVPFWHPQPQIASGFCVSLHPSRSWQRGAESPLTSAQIDA